MRLLVSVRSAAEVTPAVAGGADIIDAKEPSNGSLGPVSPAVLAAIARALPGEVRLSIALGDPTGAAAAGAAVSAALDIVGPRAAPTYVKLGLAGVQRPAAARLLIESAVRGTAATSHRAFVVAVAYADHEAAAAPARDLVSRVAADAGAHGVLLDTWRKNRGDLFSHAPLVELGEWGDEAWRLGLLVALAGSLDAGGVRAASSLPADIVGVRGAACAGGREGVVQEQRVRALREALAEGASRPLRVPASGPAGRSD